MNEDHDFVVKLLDDFKFTAPNGLKYHALILEYLPGGDLAQFFEDMLNNQGSENELPWAQNDALRISAQLVLALNYIHGKNIMHRDIKPENILMSAGQQVKIADFNVSRSVAETVHTDVAGSMDYLAPEVINSQGNSAPLSFCQDVWAVGIIFQMLCTFRHPFTAGNPFQTMTNIVHNARRPAEVIFPAMESLIRRCLVVEIGERAESAAALMTHSALVSLIEQLKNRVLPADLTFGLTRVDTTMKINGLLNRENIELKNELSKEKKSSKKEIADLKRLNNARNNEISSYQLIDQRKNKSKRKRTKMSRHHEAEQDSSAQKVARMIDEHRNRNSHVAKKQVSSHGSKLSGLERRKMENRNTTKRRRKRLYTLTPQAPNLASVPEDERVCHSDEEVFTEEVCKFQSGRRDSLGSTVSSVSTSDGEEEPVDLRGREAKGTRSRPDYMKLMISCDTRSTTFPLLNDYFGTKI
ncbi:Oidioi.mRNA.OKI2018_I69.chr2.g8373.t2.cds [Oikopleura dioica]|uniref:Oidioi.mRNA.OKI2018_I69.chr2.g8373.t2.cds n=1 Tax=Oikopleura dioica TaxID=34765 RepID=A0ABN7TF79_OIKDI|nr:Oidioi.mRNA.OKI2018_I69.chr2.g8373.t2.cds [Oikopleura dioica]